MLKPKRHSKHQGMFGNFDFPTHGIDDLIGGKIRPGKRTNKVRVVI